MCGIGVSSRAGYKAGTSRCGISYYYDPGCDGNSFSATNSYAGAYCSDTTEYTSYIRTTDRHTDTYCYRK